MTASRRTSDGYYLNPPIRPPPQFPIRAAWVSWLVLRPVPCWRNSPVPRRPADAPIRNCWCMARRPVCPPRRRPRTPPIPTQRLIYVGGQTIPTGGGAIELTIPSDALGACTATNGRKPAAPTLPPTPSFSARAASRRRASPFIARTAPMATLITIPLFPFKMRGSVDAYTATSSRRAKATFPISLTPLMCRS